MYDICTLDFVIWSDLWFRYNLENDGLLIFSADSTIAYVNDDMAGIHVVEIPTCIQDWLMDKICDDRNNIPECGYDMGDCCNPIANKDMCADCQCKDESSAYFPGTL